MKLNDIVKRAHDNAVTKGFHAPAPSFGELIALAHSELSEALECYREDGEDWGFRLMPNGKPEGVASELADVIIRVADMCGALGIDLEKAVDVKMTYNETRPHRHGGKHL